MARVAEAAIRLHPRCVTTRIRRIAKANVSGNSANVSRIRKSGATSVKWDVSVSRRVVRKDHGGRVGALVRTESAVDADRPDGAVNRARGALRVRPVHEVRREMLVPKERLDLQVHKELRGLVVRAEPAPRELPERKGRRDHVVQAPLALRELTALKERLDLRACKELRDLVVRAERAPRELLEHRVRLDHVVQAQLALRVVTALKERLDLRVRKGPRDLVVLAEPGPRELPERKGRRDRAVQAQPALKELTAPKEVKRALRGLLAPKVKGDHKDRLERREMRVGRVRPEALELKVEVGRKDRRERREELVPKVRRAPKAVPAVRARVGMWARRVRRVR